LEGRQKIILDNCGYLIEPGKPLMPFEKIYINLPSNANVRSVDIECINEKELSGCFYIIPSSYVVPLVNNINYLNQLKNDWMNNYEDVYLSDEFYPDKNGLVIESGCYEKGSYLLVAAYPYKYNPVSGKVSRFESVKITIEYIISSEENKYFISQSKDDNYNYLIITSSELYPTITASCFLSWKNQIGFTTKVVNVTDAEITGQSGIDLAEKIRNFLRQNYYDWGVEYVLIVGDCETVPMRYCYPDPTNHLNTAGTPGGAGGEIPTDYYYADLSKSDSNSWDKDGDGYYGEYGHDDPNFLAEVYVGRIPVSNPSRVSYTLEKIVSFEQDTGDWKKHALHPAAFFYFTEELGTGESAMDGATCCAYIENDFMQGWTISHYSEQAGLEKSVYPWDPISESAFASDWRTGKHAIVNWGAHGWSNYIARKVWSWDDGDNIPEANEITWPTMLSTSSNLDDDYPSVVTCISCYVGYPEQNNFGNLGVDMLTRPSYGSAVGVIASARTPYGTSDWPTNPGASDSIIYEFNGYLINHSQKLGEALFNSKHYCNVNYDWYGWVEYNDLYTYNLFGDPSLTLEGIHIGNKPDTPTRPLGPDSGNINEKYTYITSTNDPDNDEIFYIFDWGDGTDSGWLGPYESGETCEASHIWIKRSNYEIRSRARDTKDLLSEWSDPLNVNIPRSRVITNNLIMHLFELLSKFVFKLGFF
jgi:hypothetical protein